MTNRQNAKTRGLFDGFEGYRTPTGADYRSVLTRGMVVPDANVLLNLYRYNSQTRTDLFTVLEKLGDRLWVPHQVLVEFWRNRESALRDRQETGEETVAKLTDLRGASLEALRNWSNRIALPPGRLAELEKAMEEGFAAVTRQIEQLTGTEDLELIGDTNNDPVLKTLESVLEGRVGKPLDAAAHAEAVEEAAQRITDGRPPGYRDKGKKEDLAIGDYLVWAQLLREANTRRGDVLFVTGDVKDDWWRRERGQIRGPRIELVQELREHGGGRLFTLRPESLLVHAKEILEVQVSDESVEDVERVDRSLSAKFETPDRLSTESDGRHLLEKLPEGRSGNYLDTIVDMARLAEGDPDLESYLDDFQDRFPTITLRDVARRRMRVLLSLGLAVIHDGHINLTPLGERLIEEGSLGLLQDSFLTRIAGATEILEMARTATASDLRAGLREAPPAGLSATQSLLVLRWLEQLDLLRSRPAVIK